MSCEIHEADLRELQRQREELEAEVLRLKAANAELHQGVCRGYSALLEEKTRLERELKELRESSGEERFRLAIRQAVSDLKASASERAERPQ